MRLKLCLMTLHPQFVEILPKFWMEFASLRSPRMSAANHSAAEVAGGRLTKAPPWAECPPAHWTGPNLAQTIQDLINHSYSPDSAFHFD